jgi:hypothetical protein
MVPRSLASALATTKRGCGHVPAWYQKPVNKRDGTAARGESCCRAACRSRS